MTDPAEVRPSASRRSPSVVVRVVATLGVALFWAVLLGLVLGAGVATLDAVLLTFLLVAVPGLSLAQLPLIGGAPIERLPAYWSSIATLWLLGTACWLVGTRDAGAAALGLVSVAPLPFVLWSLGLAAAGLLTIVLFRAITVGAGLQESPLLRQLLPATAQERRVFGVLSVAAGLGEEIAYRGYAIPALAPVLGVPGAAVLTSVVFGVLHGYQGAVGILRTGTMGGILAWGFLASGSLWPPVVAHTLIDLVAGLWLGERLLPPEPTDGVTVAPDPSST